MRKTSIRSENGWAKSRAAPANTRAAPISFHDPGLRQDVTRATVRPDLPQLATVAHFWVPIVNSVLDDFCHLTRSEKYATLAHGRWKNMRN